MRRYDLAVVGGGTAGLIGALVGAGAGARVCLVERARVGGECLWRGCVPSKSLLAAADLGQRMRVADRVGLAPVEPKVDFGRVMNHVRAAQARIAPQDSPERLRAAGVDVLQGTARFAGPGRLLVDARLRTSAPGVFAAGDVTGVLGFTHVAAYQARLAVPNALFGLRRRADYRAVPYVVFTDPEVARVGLSEAAARERFGRRVSCWAFPYERLDRAITAGEGYGFAKLVGGPGGRLVGATVAAPAAGEVIAELGQWVARGARIAEISQAVHAYPTFAEGPARAADQAVRARWQRPAARGLTRTLLAVRRLADRWG